MERWKIKGPKLVNKNVLGYSSTDDNSNQRPRAKSEDPNTSRYDISLDISYTSVLK